MLYEDNQKIKNELEKVIVEYTLGREDRIKSDVRREKAVSDDYIGREIVELLQNCEDAAYEDEKTRGNGKVSITLFNDILTVENTGKPFGFEGIESIMLADNSPKDPILTDVIGNKGLGFRAILSWAESIKIASKKLCVEFDKNAVEDFKSKILDKKPDLKETLNKNSIAMLTAPRVVDNIKFISDYDTKIEIKCKKPSNNPTQTTDLIKEQIEKIMNGEVLVFLRNIQEIKLNLNGNTEIYKKEIIGNKNSLKNRGTVKLIRVSCSEKELNTEYELYEKADTIQVLDEEENNERRVFLGIAIPKENCPINNHLYSFFTTTISNPFSFLINATLELQQNRNNVLIESKQNEEIINLLIDFIYEVLEYHSQSKSDKFALIKKLAIKDSSFLEEYKFYEKYIEKIKDKKILPNANDRMIRPNGRVDVREHIKPAYSKNNFSTFCKGDLFENLILHTEDSEIIAFLDVLGVLKVSNNEKNFCETINKYVESIPFQSNENIEVISNILYSYNKEFSDCKNSPKLFLDTNLNRYDKSKALYILKEQKSGEDYNSPDWLDIRFALQAQIDILLSLDNDENIDISKNYGCGSYKPYNFAEMINEINDKSAEDITIEQIKELNKWLFLQYKKNREEFEKVASNLKVKLLYGSRKNMQVAFANEIYFPDHYDNHFIYNLLKGANCKYLVAKSIYGLIGSDDEIIEFYELLGVNKYPKEIIINSLMENEKYFDYLTNTNNKEQYFESHPYVNIKYCSKFRIECNLSSIEYIETILKKPFDKIIAFLLLLKDNNRLLYDKIIAQEKITNDCLEVVCDYSYPPYKKVVQVQTKSYLNYIFSTTKWIEYKDGNNIIKKIEPSRCSFDKINLSGYYEKPYFENDKLHKTKKNIKNSDIQLLLENFGAVRKISELNTKESYKLLTALPEFDGNKCSVGRKVYEIMYDSLNGIKSEDLESCDEYKKFKKTGLVCAVKNKVKGYYPINEVYYTSRKSLSDEILNDVSFFDFPLGEGVIKVENLFGVKKINEDAISIVDDNIQIHDFDSEFQKFFIELKPFIIVRRKRVSAKGQDATFIKNCSVYLVNSLNVEYQHTNKNVKCYDIAEYSFAYISREKKGYIVVPPTIYENFQALLTNIKFSDALAELICLVLTVSDGKESYREFIKESIENRELLLEKDFGVDGIKLLAEARDDLGIISSKKDLFYNALKSIVKREVLDRAVKKCEIFSEDNFDFQDLNNKENCDQIIKLFIALSIDVEQFNSHAEFKITELKNYHKEKYEKFKYKNLRKYETYLYLQTMKIDECKRLDEYKNKIKKYNFAENNNIVNSVYCDYTHLFEIEYQISVKMLPEEWNLDEITKNKIEEYKMNYPNDSEIITKNLKDEDLKICALLEIIPLYIEKLTNKDSKENNNKSNNIDSASIDYTSLINSVDSLYDDDDILEAETEKPKLSSRIGGGNGGGSVGGLSNEAKKQENGFIAEYYACKILREKYGELNVEWKSKYSTYEKENKNYDDGCHYDISYKDKGETHYVEVKKVSGSNISFDISNGEVKFGEEKKDKYHIYCVAVEDKMPIPEKSFMKRGFFSYAEGESFIHNQNFSVDAKDFRIKAKRKMK